MKCTVSGAKYRIYGYKGKQVRDNIHSNDLVQCFWQFFRAPKPGAVYNMGGSRHANCSMLEAIELIAELGGGEVQYTLGAEARSGDHIWWISDVRRFQRDFPQWRYTFDLRATLAEMIAAARERYARA
jgi:CDP-paratose 2-epimerase